MGDMKGTLLFQMFVLVKQLLFFFIFPYFYCGQWQFPRFDNSKLPYFVIMASPQPYRGVILAENPRSHLQQNYPASQPQRPLQQILDENEQIRQMIDKIKTQKAVENERVNQQLEPEGHHVQFNRRIDHNNQRISELRSVISSQERVIESYRQKFKDFEDNLLKLMKLDKDIHHRLVNPQPNPTLDTNVRNVLVALNGRAPYDKIMKMIESIRV